jgi:hypothetical protein
MGVGPTFGLRCCWSVFKPKRIRLEIHCTEYNGHPGKICDGKLTLVLSSANFSILAKITQSLSATVTVAIIQLVLIDLQPDVCGRPASQEGYPFIRATLRCGKNILEHLQ